MLAKWVYHKGSWRWGGGDELQAEEGGAVHTKAQVALTGAACDISMKDAHIRETCAL